MHPRPSAPDSRNSSTPQIPVPLLHSSDSRTALAIRRTRGVSPSRNPSVPFRSSHWRGSAIAMDAEHPTRLPMAAERTASIPLP